MAASAAAEEPSSVAASAPPADLQGPPLEVTWSRAALFVAGGATAFVAHESCHVLAGLALGNTPTLQPVRFLGFVPFFAISPGINCVGGTCTKANGAPFPAGPRGLYVIVSAGIICQEVEDEVILSVEPRLRYEDEAFLKGMVAFNTLASVGYALANFFSLEPPEGDLRAMSRLAPLPPGILSGIVLATAGLDIARYFLPDNVWLPWVSRLTKVATVGVVFTF